MSALELILDTPNVLHNQHIHPLGMLTPKGNTQYFLLSSFVAMHKENKVLRFCNACHTLTEKCIISVLHY